jgi:alpha-1,3-rhamnosyl/mannosyltransferase
VFNAASSGAESLEDPTIYKLGFVPDAHLPLLYQGAEAFILPSLAEGFGLPILEAMACGTPVICSDTTALPEIAGGAARLVPPLEIEAWKEAIDSVLSDNVARQCMRSDGLKQAARFSWSRTAEIVRSTLASV